MTANLLKSAAPLPEEWPELVPLDAPNLPRLNLAHLPGWAGDYARALAGATETPPELAAGMVLATCATAAARRLRVMVKPGYFEPCNLWLVGTLPSGNRKSAVESAATAPLMAWERDQAAIMEPEIKRIASERKTMEARAKEMRNKAAKEKDANKAKELAREAADLEAELPDIPIPPQLWTSDATPERLGSLLADHGECMAWLSSEGGIFDLLQGRYSNGIPNLDLVLKAHSGIRKGLTGAHARRSICAARASASVSAPSRMCCAGWPPSRGFVVVVCWPVFFICCRHHRSVTARWNPSPCRRACAMLTRQEYAPCWIGRPPPTSMVTNGPSCCA